MLLERQKWVSHQHPMPVDVADESSRVTDVAGETVQFVVAATNVNDAGSAAGTVVYGRLANTGILDSAKIAVGNKNDTSFSWVTGTVLTTQVEFPFGMWEDNQFDTRINKMAAVGSLLANGEYVIDYRDGLVIGKKATAGTSDTTNYSYRSASANIVGTVTVSGGAGGTSAVDDSAFTPAVTSVTPTGFFADEVATDSVDEGDVGVARMTLNRKQINASEFNEDTVHVSGDYGTQILGVRNDAGTALAADGDYTPIQTDSTGAVRVTGGGSSFTDDAVFTPAVSSGTPAMFFADETATDSVDEGDAGAARMTLNRKQITASEFQEDTVHVTGDYGTQMLAVRNDAGTALAADGDYTPVQTDSLGRVRVTGGGTSNVDDSAFGVATDSVVPTGLLADETATDSVDEGDVGLPRMTLNRRAITASQTADDVAPETGTKPSLSGAVFDDVAPDSVDEGDAGYVRMSANRNQYQTIRDAAGNERGANVTAANELSVIATSITTSVIPGTAATHLGKAEDAVAASGDTGVMELAVRNDTNATFTSADGDYSPVGVDLAGNSRIVGNIAASATDAGNPVKIGGKFNTTPPTLTNGQRGDLQLDSVGNALVSLNTLISGEDQTNNLLQTVNKPLAVNTYTPDADTSTAAEASSITKASAGVLYGGTFSNGNAATRYWQFFNSTTLPADATVPVITIEVPAGKTAAVDFSQMGRFFSTGIVWCNSSTQNTKTIGAADSLAWIDFK